MFARNRKGGVIPPFSGRGRVTLPLHKDTMIIADERALIARAKTSAAGFGELFDAYYDRIYAYA